MADHGDNYKRMTDEEGNEVGSLPPACGHHCGVITVGHSDQHEGHCACPECHNMKSDISAQFTSEQGGINPRGIF